jgi:YD repeat-containing protein
MTRLRPALVVLALSVISTLSLLLAKESLATRAVPQNEIQPRPSLPVATDGDPVDLSTGLYILDETDFFLPDVIPITFTRTYRPGDPASRPFGIGTMHSYELYLLRNGLCSEVRLILPDGGRIRYLRTAGTNCYDSTLVHTSTPTRFNESSLKWEKNEQKWVLRRKDGSIYRFASGGLDRSLTPFMSLVEFQDGSGNTLTIARDKLGRVTSITSPCGLWMRFAYDQGNRVTKISDILGRLITYEYDVSGRLLSVRYPDDQASRYTYDGAHQMLTIDDKSGMSFSHRYDASGRVVEQSYPDGMSYQFRYVTDDKGNIRITIVKNRRGHVRIVTFNDARYTVRDTRALGRPEEHTTIYEWQEGTGHLLRAIELDKSTPSSDGNDAKKKNPASQGETSARGGGEDPAEDNDASGGNSAVTIRQQGKSVPLESIPADERGELTTPFPAKRLAFCLGEKALSRVSAENPWNRKEIDNAWEQLIRYEQYEIIQFLDRHSANPTTHAQSGSNTLLLEDRREAYGGGLLKGGGWTISGRLESELPVEGGIWQLYSKAITRWFPGFANLLQPWYKDRVWEFQLLLRNAVNRQELTQLKSIHVSESDLNEATPTQSMVEKVPRGRLLYDEGRGVVTIVILGVKKPLEVEVPVVSSFASFPSSHDVGNASSSSSLDLFRSGSKFYIQNKFAEAIGPYQQALDLEKENPKLDKIPWRVLVDNLGMAYGITGDLKRAKETFEYGLSKDPSYSMFHYNLACTYAEMGNLESTMISLKKAYTYRANHNPGESIPDPRTDSSFQRFMKNDKFLKFLDSVTATRA